jgi:hypothetical protein
MGEDEQSGFSHLVSAIAVCGLALLAALTAPLWSGPAQNGHLSQHAFANAIDLPMFVLADGRKVDVTHDWGPTQRDLIAAAKAKKAAPAITGSLAQQKVNTKGAVTEVMKVSTSAASNSATASPNPASAGVAADAKFLRLTHDGGCKIFSTVFGPEANDAHRSHFHMDLQDRKTSVCE